MALTVKIEGVVVKTDTREAKNGKQFQIVRVQFGPMDYPETVEILVGEKFIFPAGIGDTVELTCYLGGKINDRGYASNSLRLAQAAVVIQSASLDNEAPARENGDADSLGDDGSDCPF